MKYLDQACGLRLKTAVKVIAIIGMVASLIGFSIAINRLTKMPATANHNKTTDAQALTNDDTTGDSYKASTNSIADVPKNEEYLEENHEEGSGDDIDFEATTVSPEGHEHWNDSIEDVHKTEGEEEDAIPRSKREAASNATAGTLIEGEGDPVSPVSEKAETSGDNVAIPPLPDLEYDSAEVDEAGQSSVTPGSPPVTAAPKAELSSTTTATTTISPSTDIKIEDVTSATEAEEIVEHSEDLPESKEKNIPALTDEESVHYDENVTEEVTEETEQINVQEPHQPDSLNDSSTDEDKDEGETVEDDKESSTSRASWAMTGLGVPMCLLGFVANAVLLHAAKKAEKKLLIIWILWAGLLFCYQITAMAVNLHDLSSYIFLNLLLTMLSAGAGYVVLSYSKQLSDPSSYDLKTIEMNGYSMNKGFMELDNKDKEASGSAAGGDNIV